jgi:TolB-like protein/DNA-binding winged helix-turn-helix (wHTH) protein/Tfp pilus assembly protein PilF
LESAPGSLPASIKFGDDFEFDVRARELSSSGTLLKLERIPAELLLFLIERRGELVTREQIVEKIWGKGVFLDCDNSINSAISKVRHVLRDDADSPRLIQTVTGRGYRFIGEVAEDGCGESALSAPIDNIEARESESPAPPESSAKAFITRGWPRLIAAACLALVVVSLVIWRVRSNPAEAEGRVMIAVLPFENLTGDPNQDFFSEGMTDEMITQLGQINPRRIGVIGRTSVMSYKATTKPLSQIVRELGVRFLLEGSVRRDAGRVRITAQLIQAKDQSNLWTQKYDRDLNDVLTLQGEIARQITDEIQSTLGYHKPFTAASRASVPPENYEAYELYLKGQYFLNKRTMEGFEQAIDYFQQAIVKDPNYARAYTGLADSYALVGGYTARPQEEYMQRARDAAVRALQIDESLPEAHTALALIVQNYDRDWQTAEKEYRRAIELNPNYATAHHWYAEHLMWRGRFDEALRESERARQLDPLSLIIAADHAMIFYFSRDYDRAIEELRSVLQMDPEFSRAHMIRYAYVEKGMIPEALADIEGRLPNPDAAWALSALTYVHGRAGQREAAARTLHRLLELNQRQAIDPASISLAYLGFGDRKEALTWLEKAYDQHSNVMATLKVDPAFDSLRDDPRFQRLLARVMQSDRS